MANQPQQPSPPKPAQPQQAPAPPQPTQLSQEEQNTLRRICGLPELASPPPAGAQAFPDLSKVPWDKVGAVFQFLGGLLAGAKRQ